MAQPTLEGRGVCKVGQLVEEGGREGGKEWSMR